MTSDHHGGLPVRTEGGNLNTAPSYPQPSPSTSLPPQQPAPPCPSSQTPTQQQDPIPATSPWERLVQPGQEGTLQTATSTPIIKWVTTGRDVAVCSGQLGHLSKWFFVGLVLIFWFGFGVFLFDFCSCLICDFGLFLRQCLR